MGVARETPYEFRFAIVEFKDKSSTDLLPIDLVPGSWVKRSKDKCLCKYPPKKDYEYVEKWTKAEKRPEEHWKYYSCTPIQGAADFAQGKRRLERAYATRSCASTDCEKQTNENLPVLISQSSVSQLLRANIPMDTNAKSKETRNNTELMSQSSRTKNTVADDSTDSEDSVLKPRPATKKKGEKNRSTRNRSPLYGLNDSDAKESETSRTGELSDGVDSTTKEANESVSINEEKNSGTSKIDDALTDFLNRKFQELDTSLQRRIRSSKDSVLYNIEHKMNELKLAIVALDIPRSPKGTVSELVEAVKTPLPITTLQEFQEFDTALNEDPEKKDALFALFQFLCFEHPTSQKCIENVLPRIFTKSVQGQYSGQGKKIKGVGKLNFSATATFECFKAAILAKFGDTGDVNTLKSRIGIWLTRFADREGGRKSRGYSTEEK